MDEVDIPAGIDPAELRSWIQEVIGDLNAAGGPAERSLASTLGVYEFALGHPGHMPSFSSCLQSLGTAAVKPDYLASQQRVVDASPNHDFYLGLPPEASEWGVRFLKEILQELRTAVCARNSPYSKLKADYKSYPKAFAVAVATTTLSSVGITGPMALGVATFVLLVLGAATKNAFCKMTEEEALEAVKQAAQGAKP
jgi:hypothetical protein